ncbi:hypothetical protein Tco_0360314 [Tanacetum coccineum]
MSFSKRSDTASVCYTKPLDSLKHWNDIFFWVDASAFSLSVPWHNNIIFDFLATHTASFRKFPEPFLCFVGISRYYEFDDDVYPVFLTDGDEEMDLFAFINHADPTKVQIGEKQIEEGQTPLLESTKGRVVPLVGVDDQGDQNDDVHDAGNQNDDVQDAKDVVPSTVVEKARGTRKKRKAAGGASGSTLPLKSLRTDHGSPSVGASTGGKSVVTLQGLLERSTLPVEVGVTAVATLPFITSSVSLTPEREGDGRTDSVTGPDLRTQHPAERFVISSDSSHYSSATAADDEVTSIVRSSAPPPPVLTATVATTAIAGATSAPVHESGIRPVQRSIFRDSASPSTAGADVAGPSQPTGAEHNYRERKKFERKCQRQVDLLKENDTEIVNLKAQLSLKEAEAVEAIRLRGQVATVVVVEAARTNELNGLKERNSALEDEKSVLESKVVALESADATIVAELASLTAQTAKLTHDLSELGLSCDELSVMASSLEAERDRLISQVSLLKGTCFELRDEVPGYKLFKEQIEVVQDEQVKVLSDKKAGLDAELMGMALHLDEEFYPYFLTTIAGQRWILGRGPRLVVMKCLQSLEYLAALGGPSAVYYVSAVNALCNVDFPLLAQLESHKDASIADIMGLLHLEGPAAEPLSAENLVGEASTSGVPAVVAATTALSTTFVEASFVPLIPASDYKVVDTEAQARTSSSHKIIFEEETLETSLENPTT